MIAAINNNVFNKNMYDWLMVECFTYAIFAEFVRKHVAVKIS